MESAGVHLTSPATAACCDKWHKRLNDIRDGTNEKVCNDKADSRKSDLTHLTKLCQRTPVGSFSTLTGRSLSSKRVANTLFFSAKRVDGRIVRVPQDEHEASTCIPICRGLVLFAVALFERTFQGWLPAWKVGLWCLRGSVRQSLMSHVRRREALGPRLPPSSRLRHIMAELRSECQWSMIEGRVSACASCGKDWSEQQWWRVPGQGKVRCRLNRNNAALSAPMNIPAQSLAFGRWSKVQFARGAKRSAFSTVSAIICRPFE
ncbi:hypothetical protein KCU85_g11, partial [Aureobasidium melanogenum]